MYFLIVEISIFALFFPYASPNPSNVGVPTRNPYWGALRARFGFGPDYSQSFFLLPVTVTEAVQVGYVPFGSGCSGPACYVGNRYIRNNDNGLLLLFDRNGYIAGAQSRIPDDPQKNYPPKYLIPYPFVKEDNFWTTTTYFIEPSRICTGRSREQVIAEGIGDAFYFQNGSNPLQDIIYIPKFQRQFNNAKFYKIGCLAGMGTHYVGYEPKVELDCDTMFPLIPIYDHGILISMDWAYLPIYESPIFERIIPAKAYAELIGTKPTCLLNLGDKNITTLHIYMIDNPKDTVCTTESTIY